MIFIIGAIIVIATFLLGRIFGFNIDYTRGANIYKSSNENPDNDQFLNIADHKYYDHDGKMK